MSTITNHEISLQTAIDMTSRYKGKRPINFPICETFEKTAIQKLLDTAGCASFRIYYGMKEEDQRVHAIIVGFDGDGKDILPITGIAADGTDPIIVENGTACPTDCPPSSDLNG